MKFVSRRTNLPVARAVVWCSALALLYTILIFTLPANTLTQENYQLSSLEYRAIMFALAIPSIIVWFTAFIGYGTLKQYAHAVQASPEGKYFHRLSQGCTWLVWSLPIPVILAFILNAIANTHANFHPTAIIIANYVNLLLPLIAFTIISLSSHQLLQHVHLQLRLRNIRLMTVLFVIFGLTYCYLTFSKLDLSSLDSSQNPYFLPLWLLVITLITPYLYSWFIGLVSVAQIVLFSRNATGLIYRRAFTYLAIGLVGVIISSIALQYVNTVIPRVGHVQFDYRLVANILFRVLGAFGFIFIAIGAQKLRRIEEV